VWVALALAAGVWVYRTGPDGIRDLAHLFYGTAHDRYAASLKRSGLADTPAGRRWLESARQSVSSAPPVNLPRRERLSFTEDDAAAAAFAVSLRRGQRYIAEAAVDRTGAPVVFVDVFERTGGVVRHVAGAEEGQSSVTTEIRSDGEYVVRVQPELRRDVRVTLALRAEPTLRLPVERAQRPDIQSFFGAARDAGRREHQGVDIFAPRGTAVIAAAGGIVSSVGTNTLGGNVVWVARPARGEVLYYAHLDQQRVTAGTLVKEGDVIGTVGNTGNARSTVPHLHFGIYTAAGAVDPLPYISVISMPRSIRHKADAYRTFP
jgi:peptidoglycan LD-endopeptidase LytH